MTIENMRKALLNLEPARDGFIRQSFLENELEQGILRAKNTTIQLTNEANAIMQTVSDIVALPPLREDGVVRACDEAIKFKDETIEKLVHFDNLQMKAVLPVDDILQSITEQIQFMEDIFIKGDINANAQTNAVGDLSCERDASTDIKDDKAWYETVADVIIGAIEGIVNAIVDIFKGLFDLLVALLTDPIGFFKGIATAIFNPADTFNAMWGAVEAAWERDVINGDARSRASFFSYAIVSVVGLKGVDKLGKATFTIPYNVMKTGNLKDLVKKNVFGYMQQKGKQLEDLWNSNFSKEAITKTLQAVKNSAIVSKARNVLNPENLKAFAAKTYDDVIKAPVSKTWSWMKDHVFNVKVLDGFQTGLDVAGMIPGFGEIADGINGLIYTVRGDKLNAALSYSAMIPIVGSAGTAGKLINKTSNAVDNLSDAAGKTKKIDNVDVTGKATGEHGDNFVGNLKGEKVHLKDVKMKEIIYTKRASEDTVKLRKEFDSKVRKIYLKEFAKDSVKVEHLINAGLNDKDIARMENGLVPKGWQVHHKLPLDDGGTNALDNLILIKNDPYHKAITNKQNEITRGLEPGQNKTIDWPIPDGSIYPPKKDW